MTLVVDNLPPALSEALAKIARDEGRTLQDVAIDALKRGLRVADNSSDPIDLTDIVGTWVEDPEFDRAMQAFETIDSEIWK
jgi:hypothetical protein